MAVVREHRQAAAEAIARYMRREIDNFAFDTALIGYNGADEAIRTIAWNLWFTYDDIKRHCISVTPEGWKAYRRCIAFLKTDLEIGPDAARSDQWPFSNRRELIRSRPDVRKTAIPKYDPAAHASPIRSKWEHRLMLAWSCATIFAVLAGIAAWIYSRVS